ncbi:MAG: tRNA (adenosine(37)-N6)-threonylcarbamoyltransferase complex transferase subunit TsaD [Patescibacteria group bacterium]
MKILAIETSCDETAVALLEISGPLEKPDIKVLGNTLMSQVALHEKYGGVYPNLAKREHIKNLPVLLEKTLGEAGCVMTNDQYPISNEIDFIAVTAGPGLEPALWAGITFAEELGKRWKKPVMPVNHMEGHIYSVLYKTESNSKSQILNPKSTLELPAVALLVSGGHTELVFIRDFGKYEIIGRTLDDAVGEAFDKVGRLLGLPYPGGPKISRLAEKSRARINYEKLPRSFSFPRPMINSGNLNFSYSGLKTAVLYKLRSEKREDEEFKEDMARAFEDAAVAVLVEKTRRALLNLGNEIKTLIVAGGVAANTHLINKLNNLIQDFPGVVLRLPEKLLATDNAVMIGIAGFIDVKVNPDILKNRSKIKAMGNLNLTSSNR